MAFNRIDHRSFRPLVCLYLSNNRWGLCVWNPPLSSSLFFYLNFWFYRSYSLYTRYFSFLNWTWIFLLWKIHDQRKVCVHKVEKQKQAEVESFLCGLCNRGLAGKRALNVHQQNKVCVRHVEKLKQAKVESLCSLCNRRFAANRH